MSIKVMISYLKRFGEWIRYDIIGHLLIKGIETILPVLGRWVHNSPYQVGDRVYFEERLGAFGVYKGFGTVGEIFYDEFGYSRYILKDVQIEGGVTYPQLLCTFLKPESVIKRKAFTYQD